MVNPKKYYVVWKGRNTGIFDTWEECSRQVTGFVGAEYKSFPNRASAESAFQSHYEEFKGKRISTLSPVMLDLIGKPIEESYCVDAACSGSPGPLEYRCVHTSTHRLIFHAGPYPNGTNNIGEFLAIVHALAFFTEKKITAPLYTDSETALTWVRQGRCKTKLAKSEQTRQVYDLIHRAEDWLARNRYSNRLLKWDTNAWGEIPADFGRK